MRKAANVIAIISFLINTIGVLIIILVTRSFPVWAWLIWILYELVGFVILVTRPTMIDSDHKVACGVLTLLFISVLAGIFTFCIPDHRPSSGRTYNYYSNSHSSTFRADSPYKVGQKVKLLSSRWEGNTLYKEGSVGTIVNITDNGLFFVVRFDSHGGGDDEVKLSKYCVTKINETPTVIDSKPLGNARSELTELKQLYEDGLISEKEYELKKKQILGL